MFGVTYSHHGTSRNDGFRTRTRRRHDARVQSAIGTWISIAFIVIVVCAEEHPTEEHLTNPGKPYGRSQCESN